MDARENPKHRRRRRAQLSFSRRENYAKSINCFIAIISTPLLLFLVSTLFAGQSSAQAQQIFLLPNRDLDNLRLAETTPVDSVVYKLEARDPADERRKFSYLMTGDVFTVDEQTGEVKLARPLDREKQSQIKLVVSVVDNTNDQMVESRKRTVIVEDVDDSWPLFGAHKSMLTGASSVHPQYQVEVSEIAPVNSIVLAELQVTDADEGPNAEILFECRQRLSTNSACETFSIDHRRIGPGKYVVTIRTKLPLDYERIQSYKMCIVARGKRPSPLKGVPLETEAIVNISVNNVQDEEPVFVNAPYALSMPEGLKTGTKLLNIIVQDGDASSQRDLSLIVIPSPYSDYFQVVRDSEASALWYLQTNQTIDRENPLISKTGSNMFSISVLAAELDSSTGEPVASETELNSALTEPNYSKGTLRKENVTIVVLDLPDSVPTFIHQSTGKPVKDNRLTVNVSESLVSGSPLPNLDLAVVDLDQGINSRFNLTLIDFQTDSQPASSVFSLDSETIYGKSEVVLKVLDSSLLDFENPAYRRYKFSLVASKNSDPLRVQILEVQVNIQDANDNPPEFDRDQYVIELPEGSLPGTLVATIKAKDRDSGVFGKVDYLLRGQGASKFKLISSEGKILVSDCGVPQCLDYESQPSFSLTYEARDGGGRTRNASVIVNLIDINDHAPKFSEFIYRRELISDNLSSKQTYIAPQLIVRARDGDGPSQGRNNITYRISSTNLTGLEVDPITGLIYLSQPVDLDRILLEQSPSSNQLTHLTANLRVSTSPERRLVFEAEVVAEDNGSPMMNSTAKILLSVKGNRDGAPQFTQDQYQAFVNENQPLGKPFFSVRAIDPDEKDSQLRYSLGYDLNDLINVNSMNGELSFKTKVDYDDFNGIPYNITVIATDGSKPFPLKALASVSISVQDINNKSPKFVEKEYKSTLVQGRTKTGDPILQVGAIDLDKNANLNYSIVQDKLTVHDRNGQLFTLDDIINSTSGYISQMNRQDRASLVSGLRKLFHINKKSGLIDLRGEPDYSFATLITITVRVQDLNQEVFSASGELQQDFVKCNFFLQTHTDRSPIFAPPWSPERRDYNLTMLEELVVGTPIFSLLAKDPATNQRIETFEKVFESDPKDLFRVDRSGIVYVNRRIDYDELDRSERLVVSVKALTNDVFFSIANLHIQVIDLNDNAPQFKSQNYSVSLNENATYPYEVITVSAEDKDSGEFGQVYYYLSGYSSESFTIDPRKGIINLRKGARLDRDSEPNYLLIVTAADCNETKLAVSGDFAAGVTTSSLDVSARPGCKRSSTFVNITLLDENDNDPVFLNVNKKGEIDALTAETVSVGSIIAQVVASDLDEGVNGQVSYEIVRGADPISSALKIDQDGYIGVASSLSGLGRATPYKVLIRATDHGAQNRQSHATLLLTVSDVVSNDGVPRFVRPTPEEFISISESAGPSTFVYQVQAVDPDEDSNGKIMYKLVQPSDVFEIDPFSGIIKTQLRSSLYLDREQVSSYTLIVLAQDLGSPPKQAHQVLTIHVTDVNDNEPYFDRQINDQPLVLHVEEEVPVGTLVGHIQAIDKDVGQNALVGYDIIEGNSNNLFRLEFRENIQDEINHERSTESDSSNLCKIFTNGRLDRELKESYTLTIKATSLTKVRHPFIQQLREPLGSRNTLNQYNASDLTKIRVVVKVLDVNDNRPAFVQQNSKSVVDSSAEVYSQLMVFKAIDADSSSAEVHYSILDVLHYPDSKFRYGESLDLFGVKARHLQSPSVPPVSMRHAFDIDPRLGILRNSISLRPYVDGYFEVFVKADSGQPVIEDLSNNGLLNGFSLGETNKCGQQVDSPADSASGSRSSSMATNGTAFSDLESCNVAVSKAVVFVTHQRDTFRFVFNKTKLNDRLDEFKSKIQSALEEMMFEPNQRAQASSLADDEDAPLPMADKIFLNTFNTDFYEREDGSLDFSTLTSCSQLVKFDDRSALNRDDLSVRQSTIGGGTLVPNQVMSYDEVVNLLKNLNSTQTRNSSGRNKSSLFSQYGLVNIERCQLDKTLQRMSLAERVAIYFAISIAVVSLLLAFTVSRMRKSYERNLKLLQRSKYQYMNQPYASLGQNMMAAAVAASSRPGHHMSLGTLPGAANLVAPHYASQMDMDGAAYDTWQL